MIRKFTSLAIARESAVVAGRGMSRQARLSDFRFTPKPGMLYVTTRAISSRVNANFDAWPSEELRKSYRTFVGRPVFVDHNNWDHSRSRGVVLDSKLHEGKLSSGHEDTSVELLIEVDARAFPKLARAILSGGVDAVSMGADVSHTICSICGNRAVDTTQYCAHIPNKKGQWLEQAGIRKLCFEDCYGVGFFELSFVFDPADESALINDKMLWEPGASQPRTIAHIRRSDEGVEAYGRRLGLAKVASRTAQDKVVMRLPADVDTSREEAVCPRCGQPFDGITCQSCGFEAPPPGLEDPDTAPEGNVLPVKKEDGKGDGDKKDDKDKDDGKGKAKSDDKGKDDGKKKAPPPKGKGDGKSDGGKPKARPKKGGSVSRFDEVATGVPQRRATPMDAAPLVQHDVGTVYNQSGENPANSTAPYGTPADPNGTATPAPEAPFATTQQSAGGSEEEVRDLDDSIVQGPPGQSAVSVTGSGPGPDDMDKLAARLERRAARIREAAERKRAENIVPNVEVRNLDDPPPVAVMAPGQADVTAPTAEGNQLQLADTPDTINDGSETGLPIGWTDKARQHDNNGVGNPANTVGPYAPPNATVPQVAASTESDRVARVYRIAAFVDVRADLGLTPPDEKAADIAKFEEMSDDKLEGYAEATEEIRQFAAARVPAVRARRTRVTAGASRAPSLGDGPRPAPAEDPAADALVFMGK